MCWLCFWRGIVSCLKQHLVGGKRHSCNHTFSTFQVACQVQSGIAWSAWGALGACFRDNTSHFAIVARKCWPNFVVRSSPQYFRCVNISDCLIKLGCWWPLSCPSKQLSMHGALRDDRDICIWRRWYMILSVAQPLAYLFQRAKWREWVVVAFISYDGQIVCVENPIFPLNSFPLVWCRRIHGHLNTQTNTQVTCRHNWQVAIKSSALGDMLSWNQSFSVPIQPICDERVNQECESEPSQERSQR